MTHRALSIACLTAVFALAACVPPLPSEPRNSANSPGHDPTDEEPAPQAPGTTAEPGAALALTPASLMATIAFPQRATFAATGGTPPYAYAIESGPGTIDATSGVFTSGTALKDAVVRVTDATGKTATSTVRHFRNTVPQAARAFPLPAANAVLVAGGSRTVYADAAPRIAIFDAAGGALDTSVDWEGGFDGAVTAITVVGNTAYVGGRFTKYRAQPAWRLAKIDLATGDLDTTFTQPLAIGPATNDTSAVSALAVSGTSLYVGGHFDRYRGATVANLVKVDLVTGNLDTTFSQATGVGPATPSPSCFVNALAVTGGALYVGGEGFDEYRGAVVHTLAKLDLASGNLDTTFSTGFAELTEVNALVSSGSSLYVGGRFSAYRGVTALALAKLDRSSGSLDSNFTRAQGISSDLFNPAVNALALSGSFLYATGEFTQYRGAPAQYLVKLSADSGGMETMFTQNNGLDSGGNALAVVGDSVYVGGSFTHYRGASVGYLAKLNAVTGDLDPAMKGVDTTVSALRSDAVRVLVGGSFTHQPGTPAQGLVKLDRQTGVPDAGFMQPIGFDKSVQGVAHAGSSLYLGGTFTTYRGVGAERIAKIDATTGAIDAAFSTGGGFNGAVSRVIVDGSSVYVVGEFTSYRGVLCGRIAKLDATTGVLDGGFTQNKGFNAPAYDARMVSGALYVVGAFKTYRGVAAQAIAKLDPTTGALDGTFTQATGFAGGTAASNALGEAATSLAAAGNSLYVTGTFLTYRGGAAPRLAKLDLASGALDAGFAQGGLDAAAYSIVLSGTAAYVGGEFSKYRGLGAQGVAKLDLASGALDTTFSQAAGATRAVTELALVGNELYVSGTFSSYRDRAILNLVTVDATTGDPLRAW